VSQAESVRDGANWTGERTLAAIRETTWTGKARSKSRRREHGPAWASDSSKGYNGRTGRKPQGRGVQWGARAFDISVQRAEREKAL